MNKENELNLKAEAFSNDKEGTMDLIFEGADLEKITVISYTKHGRFALNLGKLFNAEIQRRIAQVEKMKQEEEEATAEFVSETGVRPDEATDA